MDFCPFRSTAEGSNAVATVSYIHTDHLTGSAVVTNTSGAQLQLLDYHPWGTIRINNQSSSFNEKRKFASMERDAETGLDYAKARYYDNAKGQFISQDPVHLALGSPDLEQLTEKRLQEVLTDPQSLNSYSYARDNPVANKDPDGKYFETAFDVTMLGLSLRDFKEKPGLWNGLSVLADGTSLFLPIPAIVGGIRHVDDATKFIKNMNRLDNTYDSSKIIISENKYQHVINNHTLGGKFFDLGKKSYFNPETNIRALIEDSSRYPGKVNDKGVYEKIINTGKDIGVERATGKPTSTYTVITDGKGNLITSYPGRPSHYHE